MKSTILAMLVLVITTIVAVTPIHASFNPVIFARTDKAAYTPGDSGILYLTVRNEGSQAFTVKNVSITYPWFAFVTDHWDGNVTNIITPQAIASGQTYNTQYAFTVPTDGRASDVFGGTISLKVGTDIGSGSYYTSGATIEYSVPTYQPLSLANSALPIVEIVLLGIAVAMLTLVWMGISRIPKK